MPRRAGHRVAVGIGHGVWEEDAVGDHPAVDEEVLRAFLPRRGLAPWPAQPTPRTVMPEPAAEKAGTRREATSFPQHADRRASKGSPAGASRRAGRAPGERRSRVGERSVP